MKKIYALCAFAWTFSCSLSAQFTIDGNMNEAGYTTTISKSNGNNCFSNSMDISAIKIGRNASNVYIGVVGLLDNTSTNNIVLLLNFSELLGVPAGTPLNVAGAGGPFEKNFSAGMEVDYMIRMNPGGSMGMPSPHCYIDAFRRVAKSGLPDPPKTQYLGDPGLTGTQDISATAGDVFPVAIYPSFLNTGTATSGFEIEIPFTAIGITSSSTVQVFAVIVSNDGYFSNVTVPGNAIATCLGYNGTGGGGASDPLNFNTLAGGPYASAAIALPIELMNFNAKANNSTVNLAWQTATEKSSSHFDIERSANGKDWSKIGVVKARGTSQQKVDYRFNDETPLSNLNYYRLKQVDFDGQFDYSPVVTAVTGKGKLKGFFPNPTADKITLVGNDLTNDDVITVFDLNGRNVKTQKVSGSQIDVSDLAKGFYILAISDINGRSIERVRFVKQ
jgi:Secretion system C-terminal sorting domain